MEPDLSWPTAILSVESQGALDEALYWLGRGVVVAFPTDTVYGAGVPMGDVMAVERLYRVKERPHHLAIPLLLADTRDLEIVCREVSDAAWRLAERFWPGGLTLVLLRSPRVSDLLAAGLPSVAVRLPDHPVPRELARRLGMPLATSSANLSGQPSPATAEEVRRQLGGRIPLILDGGPSPEARPSTIVDMTTEPPSLLRVGPVSREEVEAVLGQATEGSPAP